MKQESKLHHCQECKDRYPRVDMLKSKKHDRYVCAEGCGCRKPVEEENTEATT